jgi:Holliday junction resolvase RusA-like endonuclease
MFQLFIEGQPRPQGSKKAFARGKSIVLVEANKELPAWREHMTRMLQLKQLEHDTAFTTAVNVALTFWLPRPKSVKRQYATGTYDIDKLTRAVLDSITKAGVWRDDSDVVDLTVRKTYADTHEPGVLISITPFDNDYITQGVAPIDRKRRNLV